MFLKLVSELIAFTQLKTVKDVAKTWEGWLSSDNPEIVRFALDRIYDCDKYEWNEFSFGRSKECFRMEGPSVKSVKDLFDNHGVARLYRKTLKHLV